jgi:hypothetical protein
VPGPADKRLTRKGLLRKLNDVLKQLDWLREDPARWRLRVLMDSLADLAEHYSKLLNHPDDAPRMGG